MKPDQVSLCALCNVRPASSIKSHIFSQFFLRSNLNLIEDKRRGVGIGFGLGEGGVKAFVEQNAPQSRFENVFGEDLSDEAILALRMDLYSKDYFLCKNCEQRLQVVEDYFNTNAFHNPLTTASVDIIRGINVAKPEFDNRIIRLFFYSLMWRASAARFSDFQFPNSIELGLRNLLNNSLGDTLEETQARVNVYNNEIISYPIILATASSFSDPTSNTIIVDKCIQPYYFEINEYIIWYFTDTNNYQIDCNLEGLEMYANRDFVNYSEAYGELKIVLIPENDWFQKNRSRIRKKAEDFMRKSIHKYFESSQRSKGRAPSQLELENFIQELLSEDVPEGIRYNESRVDEVIVKHSS